MKIDGKIQSLVHTPEDIKVLNELIKYNEELEVLDVDYNDDTTNFGAPQLKVFRGEEVEKIINGQDIHTLLTKRIRHSDSYSADKDIIFNNSYSDIAQAMRVAVYELDYDSNEEYITLVKKDYKREANTTVINFKQWLKYILPEFRVPSVYPIVTLQTNFSQYELILVYVKNEALFSFNRELVNETIRKVYNGDILPESTFGDFRITKK